MHDFIFYLFTRRSFLSFPYSFFSRFSRSSFRHCTKLCLWHVMMLRVEICMDLGSNKFRLAQVFFFYFCRFGFVGILQWRECVSVMRGELSEWNLMNISLENESFESLVTWCRRFQMKWTRLNGAQWRYYTCLILAFFLWVERFSSIVKCRQ